MEKLILLSTIFITVLVPVTSARAATPQVALRRCIAGILFGNLLYLLAVLFLFPRLV